MLTNTIAAEYVREIEQARGMADICLGEGDRYAGRHYVGHGAIACRRVWALHGDGQAPNRRAFFARLNEMAEAHAEAQMAAAG